MKISEESGGIRDFRYLDSFMRGKRSVEQAARPPVDAVAQPHAVNDPTCAIHRTLEEGGKLTAPLDADENENRPSRTSAS